MPRTKKTDDIPEEISGNMPAEIPEEEGGEMPELIVPGTQAEQPADTAPEVPEQGPEAPAEAEPEAMPGEITAEEPSAAAEELPSEEPSAAADEPDEEKPADAQDETPEEAPAEPGKKTTFRRPAEEIAAEKAAKKAEKAAKKAEKNAAKEIGTLPEKEIGTMPEKKKRPLRGLIAALLILILLAGAAGGYLYYRQLQIRKEQMRQEALEKAQNNLTVSFLNESDVNSRLNGTKLRKNDVGGTFEYGNTVIYPEDLIGPHGGDLEVTGDIPINASKPGDYEITFSLSDTTEYGDEVHAEIVKHYTVADTAFPEIVFADSKITVTEGDDYNCASNIVSISDPVDGDLPYEIYGDLDLEEPGTYTVTVAATDKNGNRTEANFTVEVEKKYVPSSSGGGGGGGGGSSSGYDLPYEIYVNCAANTVTVYERGSGDYSNPVIAFVCSTGPGTPRGTYYTYDDPDNSVWSPYYPWWPLYGGVYGMYAYGITGDILFHSVPYYSPDPSDLEYDEFNKLGTSASMGCVRLCVRDVYWIFSHCGHGTRVVFYDDASNPGPIATEYVPKIDTSDSRRGWDPTDPNPENPW